MWAVSCQRVHRGVFHVWRGICTLVSRRIEAIRHRSPLPAPFGPTLFAALHRIGSSRAVEMAKKYAGHERKE
jgi:hypothetical protein